MTKKIVGREERSATPKLERAKTNGLCIRTLPKPNSKQSNEQRTLHRVSGRLGGRSNTRNKRCKYMSYEPEEDHVTNEIPVKGS